MPDTELAELREWIFNDTPPQWALVLESEAGEATESAAAELITLAVETLDGDWSYSNRVGAAGYRLAAGLSDGGRGEENLLLDALAIGYHLREAETQISENNTFDDDYKERLAAAAKDDPIMGLAMGAYAVAEGMPEAFSYVEDVWDEVVELAEGVLRERQPAILAALDEDGEGVTVSDEARDHALRYGYGLCLTAQALGMRGIVARD